MPISPFVQELQVASNANVLSFTVTFPQATAPSGNTAYMIVATDGSQAITPPAGWTVEINKAQLNFCRLMVLRKATASDTSATFTVGSTTSFAVAFFELTGAHALDASATGGVAITQTVTMPAITPSPGAMVMAFAAECPNSSAGSTSVAFNSISPLWNTVSVGGSAPQQRQLFGHICIAPASGASIMPPAINNAGLVLLASSGIAYASFSIL